MEKNLAVLAGDGIGPEVMKQAIKVLDAVGAKFKHKFNYREALIGGAAYDEFKIHFPEETKQVCREADAILFGSVGGPVSELHLDKWKGCETNALLGLRKAFNFNANFRPARVYPQLKGICPLKPEIVDAGIDLLIIRELSGDIYFGEHKTYLENGRRKAHDVAEYDEDTVARIAHIAFQAAQKRGKLLTSVDKANVLDTSKLWRVVVHEVAKEYPDVKLEDMLVDNCAMQIIRNPAQFDVIVTSNMFGDILSDAAAVLPGSLGLTPSASLNPEGFGMYEPSGGSAPDIAGKGIANPIAQILSAAMMLRFSFGLSAEAEAIEKAVDTALDQGIRTGDIQTPGKSAASTDEMTAAILKAL